MEHWKKKAINFSVKQQETVIVSSLQQRRGSEGNKNTAYKYMFPQIGKARKNKPAF